MSPTILQINFCLDMSRADYEALTLPMAGPLAETAGLAWKVWLLDEANQEAGGIYLFDCGDAAHDFALAAADMLHAFADVRIKQFDVLEAHSRITRGLPSYPCTFDGLAAEAQAVVPAIGPVEAQRQLTTDPDTLVIDVRDAAEIATTGTLPGALNISYGALTYQADHQAPEAWRAPQLADHDRPIITTCILGPLGALGGKLLHDMGFTNVRILAGGVQAWIDAGLPVAANAVNEWG